MQAQEVQQIHLDDVIFTFSYKGLLRGAEMKSDVHQNVTIKTNVPIKESSEFYIASEAKNKFCKKLGYDGGSDFTWTTINGSRRRVLDLEDVGHYIY